ncbi:MAG: prolyl oligopeptidase family serine peptidase [Planctomycetota bacterium]|nr:prolyl oligopeptidase family serine peptidase [Planctomycetota bacterium]
MRRRITALCGLWLVLVLPFARTALGDHPAALSGTRPLSSKRPLVDVMVDGINRFCLRELAASPDRRRQKWSTTFPVTGESPTTIQRKLALLRDRLQRRLGIVDRRLTNAANQHHDFQPTARSGDLAHTGDCSIITVRWKVLDGVTAEGVLIVPRTIRACVVAIPDADWTPEQFCGIDKGVPASAQLPRRLADAGCLVVVPLLINRDDEFSGHPAVAYTNQPHREFIYRQAFEMGRHVIGYEVQKVLAAIDLLSRFDGGRLKALPVGIAGVGEGGLLALHSAAIDPRIASTLVCGYFDQREAIWREPIYRNVFGLLDDFGDAELVGLIAPRQVVIEPCRVPGVDGPPAVRPGRRSGAAPGRIVAQRDKSVRAEFDRSRQLAKQWAADSSIHLVRNDRFAQRDAGSIAAIQLFASGLKLTATFEESPPAWQLGPPENRPTAREQHDRQKRQFDQLQARVQSLMRQSPQALDRTWSSTAKSVKTWSMTGEKQRRRVYDELIGRLPDRPLPANPRTRLVLDHPKYRGYEVMLDVFPDVIASGLLLLPRDQKPGQRRPVVVCQHGLEGTAMDTVSSDPRAFRFYKAFAEKLCLRGFVVYAPQNPYHGRDRFRTIQRKSNPLARTLYSYIIPQHEQTLRWLATLPQVDPRRIGFYGLSYGGKTAMRVPPFVSNYSLAICSADFTDWIRSIAGNDTRYNYIFTSEYEIPEWNMGHVASYAELAMLMTPRPFMVEQGRLDGGAPPEWVANEYARFRRHYDKLGIGEKTEIEFFDGPHTINAQGTFRFLHRHLDWPQP